LIEAILWDVDGTLAETERDGHRVAFNQAFQSADLPWRWNEQHYRTLLAVAGGRERLLHDMQFQEYAPIELKDRERLAQRLHRLKNEHYAEIVAGGHLKLRDGVRELLDECVRARVRMAIVTTTSRCNVDALLSSQLGEHWETMFAGVVCAEQAPKKKPNPQAHLLALQALRVPAAAALAIEDAPAGVAAARAAGVPVIVTHSHYFAGNSHAAEAAPAPGVLAAGPSLGRAVGWSPSADPGVEQIGLDQLHRWHSVWDRMSRQQTVEHIQERNEP
jgi:HAD superfamily hydrolase (TIGR01509 family)